jgi:hypothetical protein
MLNAVGNRYHDMGTETEETEREKREKKETPR